MLRWQIVATVACLKKTPTARDSLRKTAINDAIRNGAQMHVVRAFAGHRVLAA
jgi:hypothetical protein